MHNVKNIKLIDFLKLILYLYSLSLPLEGLLGSINFLSWFKIIGILIFALFILVVISKRKYQKILFLNLKNKLSIYLLLFILWSGFSILWALEPYWALQRIFTYLGLFIVMHSLGLLEQKDIKKCWNFVLIGILFSIPLGFVIEPPKEQLIIAGRFTSGGKDPNDYANLILITMYVLFFGFDLIKRHRFSFFRIGLISLMLMAIFLTLSRTAIANLIGTFILGLLFLREIRKKIILYLIVCFIAFGTIYFSIDDFKEKFERRITESTDVSNIYAWAGRFEIWMAAIRVFMDNPIKGIGTANFAYISPSISYYAALQNVGREDEKGGVAHNVFLSILSETGIIGFFLYMCFYISILKAIKRTKMINSFIYTGHFLGFIGVFIAGMTLTWEYVKIPYFLYGSILSMQKYISIRGK